MQLFAGSSWRRAAASTLPMISGETKPNCSAQGLGPPRPEVRADTIPRTPSRHRLLSARQSRPHLSALQKRFQLIEPLAISVCRVAGNRRPQQARHYHRGVAKTSFTILLTTRCSYDIVTDMRISQQTLGSGFRPAHRRSALGLKTAENSERTANILLFFCLQNWRRPRISAGDGRSIADNFREKQRKQRKCRAPMMPPAGVVHPISASETLPRRFLDMAAELVAHRGDELGSSLILGARNSARQNAGSAK
jgi:hypothetical protein